MRALAERVNTRQLELLVAFVVQHLGSATWQRHAIQHHCFVRTIHMQKRVVFVEILKVNAIWSNSAAESRHCVQMMRFCRARPLVRHRAPTWRQSRRVSCHHYAPARQRNVNLEND